MPLGFDSAAEYLSVQLLTSVALSHNPAQLLYARTVDACYPGCDVPRGRFVVSGGRVVQVAGADARHTYQNEAKNLSTICV